MFLDTSYCIDLMRERMRHENGPASRKLLELADVGLYMSVFVACELQAGACMAARPAEELRKVGRLAEHVELVFPDRSFAVAYGEAEALLRRKGHPIPTMDLMIGVQAKLFGMPLLAGRDSHFRKIQGLIVEDY
jgi:tRNA(fMet)-specific endonuclease VapC